MENVWLILAVCAISAGCIVFELQALGNKLQLYEHNLSELKYQQSAERKENEHIWKTISRLEKQIEVTKIKMEKLNTDIKNRDDILIDLDKKANSLRDVLQNTVNEMEKLLGQVASMDDQILDMRDRITTLSRSEYHWLLKKNVSFKRI